MFPVNVRIVYLDDIQGMAFVQCVMQAKRVIVKILAVVIAKPDTNVLMVVVESSSKFVQLTHTHSAAQISAHHAKKD